MYVRSMLLHYTLIEQRATFRRVDSGMACQSWGQWGGGPIKIIVRARKNERSVTISIVAPERKREKYLKNNKSLYQESEPSRKYPKITDFQHPLAAVTFNQRGNRDPERTIYELDTVAKSTFA